MNFKQILLCTWLLTSNNIITPFSYMFSANSEKNYTDQFKDFMSIYEHENFVFTGSITAFISLVIGLSYIGDRYYAEKNAADRDYPYAQLWYNNLCEKYPLAHLEEKKLLQVNGASSALFYNIYLSKDSLRQINKFYEKQLDQQSLTADEIAIMAQEEFMILSHAASIDHNCFINKQLIFQPSFIAAFTLIYPLLKTYHPITEIYDLHDCLRATEQFQTDSNILSIGAMCILFGELACLQIYQQNLAHSFACEYADNDCLHGALSFCLDHKNTHTSQLELIKKELSEREQNHLL